MTVVVGYQGEPGAYSEAAAREVFGNAGRQIEAKGYSSFEDVFGALVAGETEYAAVPIENTLGGSIHVNYDLLLRYHGQLHILGEHSFRVRHTLMALPGVSKSDIKEAMSHPQALAQTDGYLRAAKIKPVPAYDTAGSAKLIAEKGLRDTAAIASSRAAEVHGLEVTATAATTAVAAAATAAAATVAAAATTAAAAAATAAADNPRHHRHRCRHRRRCSTLGSRTTRTTTRASSFSGGSGAWCRSEFPRRRRSSSCRARTRRGCSLRRCPSSPSGMSTSPRSSRAPSAPVRA